MLDSAPTSTRPRSSIHHTTAEGNLIIGPLSLPPILFLQATMSLITQFNTLQSALFPLPIHPTYFPYPPLDVLGAVRLSIFVTQFTRKRNGVRKGERLESELSKRPGFAQEGVAIMVLILGGETFLAALTQQTPSWLLSPALPILFLGTHYLLSRTSLAIFIPSEPTLAVELPLSLFDALGRSLVLTTFSIDGLVPGKIATAQGASGPKAYPGLWQLLLTPFINTVPFASLTFALDMYSASGWSLSIPGELRKGGWTAVDCWSPVLIGFVYVWLTGMWGGGGPQLHQGPSIWGGGIAGLYDSARGSVIDLTSHLGGLTGWKLASTYLPDSYQVGLTHPYLRSSLHLSTLVGAGNWTRSEARGVCGLIITFLFACRVVWNLGGGEEWYNRERVVVIDKATKVGQEFQAEAGARVDALKEKAKALKPRKPKAVKDMEIAMKDLSNNNNATTLAELTSGVEVNAAESKPRERKSKKRIAKGDAL